MLVVEVFVQNVLARFTTIKTVCLIGSKRAGTQEEGSDLDILVLVDDTEPVDKDYMTRIIKKIGSMINSSIHCQVLYLKEFWRYLSEGSPITFTMIRDSTIYYDVGFFETLQRLVRSGTLKPKPQAVQHQLDIAKQLIKITHHSVHKGLINNLEGAIVSSTQSLLMEMGVEPPAPKQVPVYIKRFLVDREIIADEYYGIARKVIQTFKDIEHNKRPQLSGKELQELYNDTNKFVTKVEQVLSAMKEKGRAKL